MLTSHGGELDAIPFRQLDQRLILGRLTGKPVGVPGHDDLHPPGLGVGKELLITGPALARERTQVVVLVDRLDYRPALAPGQLTTGRHLTLDPETLLRTILAAD
jgi:hypothetical protein